MRFGLRWKNCRLICNGMSLAAVFSMMVQNTFIEPLNVGQPLKLTMLILIYLKTPKKANGTTAQNVKERSLGVFPTMRPPLVLIYGVI